MRATFGISACIATSGYYRRVDVPLIRELRHNLTMYPPYKGMVVDTTDQRNFAFIVAMQMAAGSSGDVVELMTGCSFVVEFGGVQKVAYLSRWQFEQGYHAGEFQFGGLPQAEALIVRPLRLVDRNGIVRWSAE